MAYQLMKELSRENWVKLSGVMTVQDFKELQNLGELAFEWFGQFRVLIELENFEGWSQEPEWQNVSFADEKEERTLKMAMVGDGRWKDEGMLFLGMPMRKAAIEFFPTERIEEAWSWLTQDA